MPYISAALHTGTLWPYSISLFRGKISGLWAAMLFFGTISALHPIFYDDLWPLQSYNLHIFTTLVFHEVRLLTKALSPRCPTAHLWLDCACCGNPSTVILLEIPARWGSLAHVETWKCDIMKLILPAGMPWHLGLIQRCRASKHEVFFMTIGWGIFIVVFKQIRHFLTKSSSISGFAHIGRLWDEY